MYLDRATGWCAGVRHCPSPNFNERPDGEISLLVIHNISLPPGQFGTGRVQQFFQNCLPCGEHPFFAEIAELPELPAVRRASVLRRDRRAARVGAFSY